MIVRRARRDVYQDVDTLRQRLRLTGDLPENAVSHGPHYDPVLVEAVQTFQHRHSLNTEGVLGPNTFARCSLSEARPAIETRRGSF